MRIVKLISLQVILITLLALANGVIGVLPVDTVYAAPADVYWVGGTGNWTDAATHWSNTTGGVPDVANLPTSTSNVHFDASSFTGAGQIVTVDAASNCLNMDWTGASNSPTLTVNNSLNIYGNITFITAMTVNGSSGIVIQSNTTLTTNSLTLGCQIQIGTAGATGNLALADDLTSTKLINNKRGTFTTNNFTVTCALLGDAAYTGAKTLTLGSSTINCTSFEYGSGGLVLTANTATINVSGTGNFYGGSVATYNIVNLNGTAHTISGSNTFNALTLLSTQTQTITFTGASNQTATTFNLGGSLGHVHTLQSSNTTNWVVTKASGTVSADYISISRSTATGGATFNAIGASVNGGNNIGWNFPLTTYTLPATGVTMDKDAVTGGVFNGNVTDMGGANDTCWFQYGLTAAYGSNTTSTAVTAPGSFNRAIPTTLTPGETYHFRSVMNNGTTEAYGSDATFTFTMPTATTQAGSGISMTRDGVITGTFNGTITDMGVATSTYANFQYGLTALYGSNTALATKVAAAAYTASMPATLTPGQTYHYRSLLTNGTINSTGGDQSFTLTMPTFATAVTNNYMDEMGTHVTLNNVISSLGSATDCYVFWVLDGVNTAEQVANIAGTETLVVDHLSPSDVHTARAAVRVGTVTTYGSAVSFTIDSSIEYNIQKLIPLAIILAVLILSLTMLTAVGVSARETLIISVILTFICWIVLMLSHVLQYTMW